MIRRFPGTNIKRIIFHCDGLPNVVENHKTWVPKKFRKYNLSMTTDYKYIVEKHVTSVNWNLLLNLVCLRDDLFRS